MFTTLNVERSRKKGRVGLGGEREKRKEQKKKEGKKLLYAGDNVFSLHALLPG
jgi:hypothetical protein